MNLYPKPSVLEKFHEMQLTQQLLDNESKNYDYNDSYYDYNYTGFDCPVGKPYPWIFELPRIFTQNFTSLLEPLPLEEVVLKVIAYTIAIVTALAGNILVIVVVARHKKLQNRTNFYVTNLAVSDLMVTTCCMWVHLGSNISPNWPFGAEMCSFQTFAQVWSVAASVLFMSIIAADRFFVIVFPLKARMSGTAAALITLVAWCVAGIVALPNLFVWKIFKIHWKDQTEVFCEEAWPRYFYETASGECLYHMPSKSTYFIIYISLFYFVPLVGVSAAYGMIVEKLWHRKVESPSRSPNRQISTLHRKTRRKVVKMLLSVLLAFFICWTPFQVIQLYNATRSLDEHYPEILNPLSYVAAYLAYGNSALNPILYAGLNEGFRTAFKQTLCGGKGKRGRVFPDLRTTPAASPNRATRNSSAILYTISTQVHLQVPRNPLLKEEDEGS